MSLFLDPQKPLTTCSSPDCLNCPVKEQIVCHFNGRQLARFLLITLPFFILSCIGLIRINTWLFLLWFGLAMGFFYIIENRVMCSHCPHYADNESSTLKCWANYSVPKIFKYRPGPMSTVENILFFTGLASVFLFPPVFMLLDARWTLLALSIIALAGGAWFMSRTMCNHCMNFACPLNRVDKTAREAFFERNPSIARAWQANRNNRL